VTTQKSKAHRTTTRAGHQLLERGTIASYDAGSHTATVHLLGSQANLVGPIPVAVSVDSGGSPAGAACLVVFLDTNNPQDSLIVAVLH
jgi:hypothetical protein